jgi:manganese transport system ATP-binding protein
MIYGDRVAFRASDVAVPSGMITNVIGPNGSGKSTLLNAIAGLTPLADGTLEVLGSDPFSARARTSLVLQATKVNDRLPVTVGEVVMMSRYVDRGAFGFSVSCPEANGNGCSLPKGLLNRQISFCSTNRRMHST